MYIHIHMGARRSREIGLDSIRFDKIYAREEIEGDWIRGALRRIVGGAS